MDIKYNLPSSLGSEGERYNSLFYKGTNRTSTGNVIFTSTTSATTYSTEISYGGIYAGLGENGLLNMLRDQVVGSYLVDEIWSNQVKDEVDSNTNVASDISAPKTTTISLQEISFTENSVDTEIFTLDIPTTVSGGAITIKKGSALAKPLLLYDLSAVEELEAGYIKVIEKPTVFIYAPSGGADEWGGLEFVISYNEGILYGVRALGDISMVDQNTLLELNQFTTPSTGPQGIGGIIGRIYHTDYISDLFYELDLETLLVLSSVSSISNNDPDIGGISNRLYSTESLPDVIHEVDVNTKLSISSVSAPATSVAGIGGTLSRLYHSDSTTDLVYELDLDTKLSISSALQIANPKGIGGSDNRLFLNHIVPYIREELDLNTKLPINTADLSAILQPSGVGGAKGASIISIDSVTFNGTTYELTDDSDFRVSGVSI